MRKDIITNIIETNDELVIEYENGTKEVLERIQDEYYHLEVNKADMELLQQLQKIWNALEVKKTNEIMNDRQIILDDVKDIQDAIKDNLHVLSNMNNWNTDISKDSLKSIDDLLEEHQKAKNKLVIYDNTHWVSWDDVYNMMEDKNGKA